MTIQQRSALLLVTLGITFVFHPLNGGELKDATKQLVVGIAPDWGSSHVQISLYERGTGLFKRKQDEWRMVRNWPGRLGRNGLAWGIGLHDIPAGATMKQEGDGKTPAGMFDISHGAYGYAPSIRRKSNLPYRQVTSRSLWYSDPASPHYNKFRIIRHEPQTITEKKAQMRQNDYAHALKLFIAHNYLPKPRPGYGSSIFFHIWRDGGTRPTAGCTVMSKANLESMIAKIDPSKNPVYVILPVSEYQKVRTHWKLP